jgi:CBS domain-containing protein
MKKCDEVMTKNPVCCLPNDMVAKAAELGKSENIGSIPVIENEQTKKLVGIVTDRDLALKIVAERRDAKSTKVEAVMTRKVVTCRAEDDLQKALDSMSEHQLRRIPVVDNDNKILGIIAQADVAALATEFAIRVARRLFLFVEAVADIGFGVVLFHPCQDMFGVERDAFSCAQSQRGKLRQEQTNTFAEQELHGCVGDVA